MKKWVAILLSIVWVSGCSQSQTYEPVKIEPEIDVCEICNMSIAHENYATEVILTENEVYKFDDLGCMLEFLEEGFILKEEIAKKFVRDVNTGEWLELESAFFRYHQDFWTPMANGVVSFQKKEDAERYEEGVGEIYNYEELLEHPWSWKQ